MDITSNVIRGIAVTNLVIFGLTACSNTPAPWTQQDDSPWSAKHEAQNTASAEDVSDASASDPVLIADAEQPITETPEVASAKEEIMPVIVEDEPMEKGMEPQDIMVMLSTNYAVQVYAGSTIESVEKFKSSNNVPSLTTVKTERSGSIIYVLVDIYAERAEADAAAANLEIITGSKPWIRSLGGLQSIVSQ